MAILELGVQECKAIFVGKTDRRINAAAPVVLVSAAVVFGSALLSPGSAGAQSTAWTGTVGDWGTSGNWSNGVPTAGVDVTVPFDGTPTVTLTGETCRSFANGLGAGGSTLRIQSGSLAVVESLKVAVAASASLVCGAGTLSVGTSSTDGTFVDGAFTLNNTPTVSMKGFTMSGTGTLSVGVGPFGVSTIMVNGAATLDGMLLVSDILAVNGNYEVLRATSLQGTFSGQSLPADWSWRIQGNSLYLTKGTVPVRPITWGRIKAGLGR